MKLAFSHIVLAYGVTAIVFFIIDLTWLGYVAKGLYDRFIGDLLRDQVNWTAALIFYAIYIGGILLFAIIPALTCGSGGIIRAAILGALLGFFAYSTFDLTCLALIRGWSITITVVDILWGTVLTGSTATIALWIVRTLFKIGS